MNTTIERTFFINGISRKIEVTHLSTYSSMVLKDVLNEQTGKLEDKVVHYPEKLGHKIIIFKKESGSIYSVEYWLNGVWKKVNY